MCVLCRRTQAALEDAQICRVLARVSDEARELERALLAGHVSRAQADALRGGHRATTRLLLEILVSRQQFERSAGFSRSGWQNSLRALAVDPEQVLQSSSRADRFRQGVEALLPALIKVEVEEPCHAQAARACPRPEVSCYTARAVKRFRLTPHPRAGPEAVGAAGGSVQAVIDEETPRLDDEEGEILAVAEGQVYSSTDEEGSDLESETD